MSPDYYIIWETTEGVTKYRSFPNKETLNEFTEALEDWTYYEIISGFVVGHS